jgi:hypothetical protein
MRQQAALGRRIPRTRTAHPYHPEQRMRSFRDGREPLCGSEISGLCCPQALKKVRRPWDLRQHKSEAFEKVDSDVAAARGRRILRTRTAHPYHPEQRMRSFRAGREPLCGSEVSGLWRRGRSKKVRRPSPMGRQEMGAVAERVCRCEMPRSLEKSSASLPLRLRLQQDSFSTAKGVNGEPWMRWQRRCVKRCWR